MKGLPVIGQRFISRLSIRNKLILMVFIVMIFVVTLSFVFIITWGVRDLRQDLLNSTRLQAKLIGEYCISPLVFEDARGAAEVLEKTRSIPVISHALLFDATDSLVARYPYLNDPSSSREAFTAPVSGNPAVSDLLLVGIMLALLLAGYFQTDWLQRFISGPIFRLTEFTNRISREGNYALRIPREGEDEIGVLFSRFNEMLEQIGLRETASREAEKEVRLSNKKLSLILENSPLGFLHYDTILDASMKEAFEQSLQGEPARYSGLYTSTTSFISRHIRAIYTPLFTGDQGVIGGIGIFEDISEQKRSEKLQVEKEAAVYANKAKSIFLANMSHEIRAH